SSIQPSFKILYDKKQPYLVIFFIPYINSNQNELQLLKSFTISYNVEKKSDIVKYIKNYSANSVLKDSKWFKIKINTDGIYKLSYDELVSMGLTNIGSGVRVFGNGGGMLPVSNSEFHYDDLNENAIYINKGSDGVFNSGDYILFYAKAPVVWSYDPTINLFKHTLHLFSDYSYYYITAGTPKTIETLNSSAQIPTHTINSYDLYRFHELETVNLIKSGSQWFGEHFDIYTEYDLSFSFPGLITSKPIKMRTRVVARSSNVSSFTFKSNSQTIFSLLVSSIDPNSYTGAYASSTTDTTSFIYGSETVPINISYVKPNTDSEGWLDYIELSARCNLNMYASQLLFRDIKSVGTGNVGEFIISNCTSGTKIWDVTDYINPKLINSNFSGSSSSFVVETDSLREFVAFNGTAFYTPEIVGEISNQNLHALTNQDLIIVSHPDFLSYANQLANLHRTIDNLSVSVVTPEQIYNEFSSGSPDVGSIRNFMKMLYDNAETLEDQPKYLLLFGDGSYDNRSTSSSNSNYILTYQSPQSLIRTSSFVSDDYYGLLDDDEGGVDGFLDIGIGRLPVKTAEEAQTAIDKINHYINPETFGDWRNNICFIGDDEDGNQHMSQANNLANKVDTASPVFNIEKIFLDAYTQESTPAGQRYPEVNRAISERISRGSLIINYTGHGNEVGWAHEQILSVNDILSWKNYDKMPVFITATCEFGRFDDYERTSAAEFIYLNSEGGGIALLTTTRLVYSTPNFVVNDAFYDFAFKRNTNNEYYRLGDLMRLTKVNSGTGTNKRNFTLLGDPALKMAVPQENVITIKINDVNVSAIPDTLKALSKITVTGQVENQTGQKLSSYKGVLYPTIFDKKDSITTLGNDGYTPFIFNVQKNILYKGKASINNGEFSFSFIVPKDISYRIGFGKISYYAENYSTSTPAYFDANGFNNNIIIGGSSDSIANDITGPLIDLYMNDTTFVYGGITDENPLFLAKLYDEHGINTVGNGIGHDITGILDGNTNNTYIFNDFYESDLDSYQSGRIKYDFSDLDKGIHYIKLKVWDVYNNSSDETIEFIVAESSELALNHIFNYPNPFTTNTSFYFDHNFPNSDLEVLIQVFTITGKLVKTIEAVVNSEGFRSNPIQWDGLDDYGDKIGRGLYMYRIKVRSPNGNILDKFEKLVILK
ncbi:MAG: type IX secretion system sortase PorU, partial [Bacteroidota bacterium]